MRGIMRFTASVSVAAATLLMAGQAIGGGVAGAAVSTAVPQKTGHLVYRGAVNLGAMAARNAANGTAAGGRYPARAVSPAPLKSAAQTVVPVPNPPITPILSQTGGAKGFVALTTTDSGAVNGFDVEPPDQGLCAHNGVVLETVNLAVRAYTVKGVALTGTVSLNQFFGLLPAVNSSHNPPTFGPFLSDPRCYYDAQTARWFLTVLEIDVNPFTGALGFRSSELIAVSQTSDPPAIMGCSRSIRRTTAAAERRPSPNCPCFGDQPRIGADAYGFYISTDSYPIQGVFNSNGGELYAMSKQGLAAAAVTGGVPSYVAIHVGAVTIGGYPANAVQPAETPQGGATR